MLFSFPCFALESKTQNELPTSPHLVPRLWLGEQSHISLDNDAESLVSAAFCRGWVWRYGLHSDFRGTSVNSCASIGSVASSALCGDIPLGWAGWLLFVSAVSGTGMLSFNTTTSLDPSPRSLPLLRQRRRFSAVLLVSSLVLSLGSLTPVSPFGIGEDP